MNRSPIPSRNRAQARYRGLYLLASFGLTFAASQALADESYGVFCANRRIEIDSRSEEQMRSNRGACQFARFRTRSDAENFARRNFGGVGSACSCR